MGKRFQEVKQIDYSKVELDILSWWEERGIFEKSLESREDGIPFTFYEGPPTANGKPGIHHVMARTVKDLFCRYKTMKGHKVMRKAGWDTHGLPVEIEVEKELGLKGRVEVEKFGLTEYNARCRESVLKYKGLWDELTKRMGYWVDLHNPYVTFENDYIESIWWALKSLYDKDLLYKGYKIQWYSPGSSTVLSSHEVSLGYKEVQDPSVYVKFQLDEASDTFFLAWTTTPWTLISNMVLAVNPEIDYVLVRHGGTEGNPEHLILAQSLLSVLDGEYEIIRTFKGQELVGKTYQPIFDYALKKFEKSQAWRVLPADFVTTEDGTGIVHIAPAYGADDYETAQKEGIPMYNPVDRDGCFTEEISQFKGMWFKDADKEITRNLRERGVLYKHQTYLHNYPHDWRKGTPLMSYPVESWFIRTTSVRDRMVALNNEINWKPASTGTGRFGTWLENNVDWAISRQRFWGTPIPIWVSDRNPDYIEVIGSVEELRKKAGLKKDAEIDLHRPVIDDITWDAPDGGTMRRIPDLLDVWFDSGAMPFAQWHYPFQNKDVFKENFPSDFIAEGVDQTRGWFYTLHALATMLFDKPAFRNVVSNGLVLDAKGEKMSKTKGNTVDPFTILQQYGADSTRWYMMSNSAPWDNLKFNEESLKETQRKLFNTIVNTYSFFAMYANIDGWTYAGTQIPYTERTEMDRWIISRQFTTIKMVDQYLDDYDVTKACREIEQFVEELSNWYVRRSRRRFWKEGKTLDKTAAYQTLYECLLNIAKLISPVAPYMGEWLFQRLNSVTGHDEESVHLSFYPTVEETAIDKPLEYRMEMARLVTSITLRIRNKVNINVRQPLSRIIIPANTEQDRQAIESVKDIILDEVNFKSIEYVNDDSGIVHKSAKPNFPVLGRKIGGLMKATAARVKELTNEEITEFEKKGVLKITLESGEIVNLDSEDLVVVRHGLSGWSVETEEGLTVAADTEITPELQREGFARELVNRLQNMRKEANYEVTDRISVAIVSDEKTIESVKTMQEYIMSETLSEEMEFKAMTDADFTKEWEIDSKTVVLAIKRNSN
ncbi:MAG: isoleucine--tRNA ligase [Bacteroidetes bacterium]|nr:isoleucine--tRNA ligase [Bacteroidota bacterium]